jgi:hypothetical protein
VWLDQLLRRAGRPDLTIRPHQLLYLAAVVATAPVGAVLGARRPRHPVGWLMLVLGLSVTIDGLTDSYARYGSWPARERSRPSPSSARSGTPSPSGRPASVSSCCSRRPARCRPCAGDSGAGIAVAAPLCWQAVIVFGVPTAAYLPFYSFPNPYFVPALAAPAMAVAPPALVLTPLSVMVGGAALVVRFRRARGMERQQLRWVTSAAVVAAAGIPVATAGIAIESPAVVGVALLGSATILCLAIAAAILRYRLYDLDRIISRTLAYGLLTVLSGLGYAAVALGLGGLLGRDSSLSVAAATPGAWPSASSRPPPDPAAGRPALQPPPPRRRPDHRRLRHPPA